jgi:hypothetical protein
VVALNGEPSGGRFGNEQSKGGWRGREGKQKWRVVPLAMLTRWDKVVARGAAGGGQFDGTQRCGHGHRLVTGSMAGGACSVTRPGW